MATLGDHGSSVQLLNSTALLNSNNNIFYSLVNIVKVEANQTVIIPPAVDALCLK